MKDQKARVRVVVVGGRMYAQCSRCGSLVRLNKPLLGSLHYCDDEDG